MDTLGHLMVTINSDNTLGIWTESLDKDSPAKIGLNLMLGDLNLPGPHNDGWRYIADGQTLSEDRLKYTGGNEALNDEWVDDYLSDLKSFVLATVEEGEREITFPLTWLENCEGNDY